MKTAALKVPTTIRLIPSHAARLKQLSAQTGRTVTSYLEAALDNAFGTKDPKSTNDATLKALAQIYNPDEMAVLELVAKRDKVPTAKFARYDMRECLFTDMQAVRESTDARSKRIYEELAPIVKRLKWDGMEFPG